MSGQTTARGDKLEAVRKGDRPRGHEGGSSSEEAIFAAAERLLAKSSLSEISVADIISEAGVSRATFYFYFSSKYAVVTGLLARLYDEMYEIVSPFITPKEGASPEESLSESLEGAARLWAVHRPALTAVHEHWPMVADLRDAWLEIVERFTDAVAGAIDRAREEGLAPDGPDSRRLAAMLLWSTDRCMYVAATDADDDVPSEQDVVEPMVTLWLGTIYGAAGAPS